MQGQMRRRGRRRRWQPLLHHRLLHFFHRSSSSMGLPRPRGTWGAEAPSVIETLEEKRAQREKQNERQPSSSGAQVYFFSLVVFELHSSPPNWFGARFGTLALALALSLPRPLSQPCEPSDTRSSTLKLPPRQEGRQRRRREGRRSPPRLV